MKQPHSEKSSKELAGETANRLWESLQEALKRDPSITGFAVLPKDELLDAEHENIPRFDPEDYPFLHQVIGYLVEEGGLEESDEYGDEAESYRLAPEFIESLLAEEE
ncbi:hypothetical protein [Silvibacterium acidisoli]|uniref:hypothetical protein n=1 Tax=Acidobacteriaceae bacterium ZG23-2 TaxID=2883246 RepID=UPI00406C3A71